MFPFKPRSGGLLTGILLMVGVMMVMGSRHAAGADSTRAKGEADYKTLVTMSRSGQATAIFEELRVASGGVAWDSVEEKQAFDGNLRFVPDDPESETTDSGLYLLRAISGEVFVLSLPAEGAALKKGSSSAYANLESMLKNRMSFKIKVAPASVAGQTWQVAQLSEAPVRGLLDKLFFSLIILLLFTVMVGMGMTLHLSDFTAVVARPKAILMGPLLQFGLLPFLAMTFGRIAGYPESFPFIFVGLILVCSSPGGVTSNLMTWWAKGDLALSVSMTAISTVASLVATPLLLSYYANEVPTLKIPVGTVASQILVLVVVPLAIGMAVLHYKPGVAGRLTRYFSALGVFALIFLMVTGVANNIENILDFSRYGVKFYTVIFSLTVCAMVASLVIARLAGLSGRQTRAVSLEVGLQNSSVAMTIALLLQDRVGDFHSAMFVTSGLYGLWMYVAGGLMIALFPYVAPLSSEDASRTAA